MAKATAGDAIRVVAEEGGIEAASLLADLMARNARDLEWQFEQLYLSEKAAHERTQAKLEDAYERLDRIERRAAWLVA